jgi:hypothetical protein
LPTHPITGARYPTTGSSPNGPQQIQDAVTDLSVQVEPRYADSTARDAAFTTWTSAGNTMQAGMKSFTQSDGRYWRWSVSETAWVYAGGKPPPIVGITIAGGWSAGSGRAPGVYKDASGLVHFVGALINTLTFNPNVGATLATLPAGYWPSSTETVMIPAGPVMVAMDVHTDGTLSVTASTSSSVASGTAFYLSAAAPFHPTFAGTVPLG